MNSKMPFLVVRGGEMIIPLATGRTNTVYARQVGPMGPIRTGAFVQMHLFDCRGLYSFNGFACANKKIARELETEFKEAALLRRKLKT